MKYLSLLISITLVLNLFAQKHDSAPNKGAKTIHINQYLMTDPIEVEKPLFANVENSNTDTFKDEDLLKFNYLENLDFRPGPRDDFEWKDLELYKWNKKDGKNGLLSRDMTHHEYDLTYVVFYLRNSEWTELDLSFKSGQMLEVYVDGEFAVSKYTFEKKGQEKTINFKTFAEANNHVIMVKVLNSKVKNNSWTLQCMADAINTKNTVELFPSVNNKLFMDVDHMLEGVDISAAQISAAGDYYFVSYNIKLAHEETQAIIELREAATDNTVQIYYGTQTHAMKWSPQGNKLSYMTKVGTKSWIWEYNLDLFKTYPLVTGLDEINDFTWAPNGEYLVVDQKHKTENKGINNLYTIDILSHVKTPLIHSKDPISLQDISAKGRYILFSKSFIDESEKTKKQILYQFNTKTKKLDILWEKAGDSRVKYSPNGKQLLVTAGPSFFGDVGINVKKGNTPSEYDIQAYFYTLKTQRAEAISKDFKPSIIEAFWHPMNLNYIYFRVAERNFTNVYQYTIKTKHFDLLPLKIDVINSYSFARTKPVFVYYGNSINSAKKLYVAHLELGEIQLIEYPEENNFKDILFGKTEASDFKNEEGVTIEGRLYYPPNFDETKKYPLIVYYYGGSNASERNFRGRYPINLLAANGYLVYVLQPSGAIGYGQDFSAEIKNWGKKVADEIIKGTKEVYSTHSYIDESNIGCLGASYGGFMTMYLITQTDMFSAAISHSGISSISSYWYDDYCKNDQIFSSNDFLWNNEDLYQGNPLDNINNIKTPILLLRANTDMDVPNNNCQQFFSGLQENNKDAVLLELHKSESSEYAERVLWQKIMIAYFDKHLKKQTDWWNHLYPKKDE